MLLRLKILTGEHAGKELHIHHPQTTIGRSKECDIRLPCDQVSRKHCQIELEGENAHITDLGSANGTFVNGERVAEKVPLKGWDQLLIGSMCFEVHLPETSFRTPFDDDDIVDWISEFASEEDTLWTADTRIATPEEMGRLREELQNLRDKLRAETEEPT